MHQRFWPSFSITRLQCLLVLVDPSIEHEVTTGSLSTPSWGMGSLEVAGSTAWVLLGVLVQVLGRSAAVWLGFRKESAQGVKNNSVVEVGTGIEHLERKLASRDRTEEEESM